MINYESKNYKYDNGQLYQYQTEGENAGKYTIYTTESGSFLEGTSSALGSINKTDTGKYLIGFFANDDNNAYIKANSKSDGNNIEMEGTNNTINLNLNLSGSNIPTENGIQASLFWLDTANELAHRQDFIKNGGAGKSTWITTVMN